MAAGPEPAAVCLLDVDPGLRAGLPDDTLAVARALVVAPVTGLDQGSWRPPVPMHLGRDLGFLVLEGALFRRISYAARESAELLGPGDLLRPWQRLRSATEADPSASWTVIEPGAIAVLDARVTGIIGHWPELVATVVGRALERSRALTLTLAISQMTGADLRVLALMWHLVERFGREEGDGWVVPIRLTHQMIATLAGTHRQTVTSALGQLANAGRLARLANGWWLVCGEPPEDLVAMRRSID